MCLVHTSDLIVASKDAIKKTGNGNVIASTTSTTMAVTIATAIVLLPKHYCQSTNFLVTSEQVIFETSEGFSSRLKRINKA